MYVYSTQSTFKNIYNISILVFLTKFELTLETILFMLSKHNPPKFLTLSKLPLAINVLRLHNGV